MTKIDGSEINDHCKMFNSLCQNNINSIHLHYFVSNLRLLNAALTKLINIFIDCCLAFLLYCIAKFSLTIMHAYISAITLIMLVSL